GVAVPHFVSRAEKISKCVSVLASSSPRDGPPLEPDFVLLGGGHQMIRRLPRSKPFSSTSKMSVPGRLSRPLIFRYLHSGHSLAPLVRFQVGQEIKWIPILFLPPRETGIT